jgi:adenine phosphoribosyltransferase
VAASAARDAVLRTFRWESGHADVWRVFADAEALRAVVAGLTEPWATAGVTKVLGIESRGFILGGAASLSLQVGFVAVRKSEGMLPGTKLTVEAEPDYRGHRHHLRMQSILAPADRVLLVDDWAERGSQARAVRRLVESAGATFAGVSLMVDQLSDEVRFGLVRVTAILTADELGPPV